MKEIKVVMENCYGIKKFDFNFNYSKKSTYLIYASNGVMKTSFAKTFKQLSLGKKPLDEVFGRTTECSITKEDGDEILSQEIYVIKSYEDEYTSPNTSKLMVSRELKAQYDRELLNVNILKQGFIEEVKKSTNSDIDIIIELTSTYSRQPIDFLDLLLNLYENNIFTQSDSGLNFSEIPYLNIFNDGVEKFVVIPKNLQQIQEYNQAYSELLNRSQIFKRGVFSHYNAENIANELSNNGFFSANHQVRLNGIDNIINSADELSRIIAIERNKIFSDAKMQKKFESISKELNKRALVDFRKVLEKHPEIINMIEDYKDFRIKSLNSILKSVKYQYEALIDSYKLSKKAIEDIIIQARKEKTEWEKVLDIFNNRFKTPVIVDVPNQDEVLLNEGIPEFNFKFCDEDTGEEVTIQRKNLENILSQGEKRALYLLNIIFDLEALKSEGQEVLIVADDVSESFDYKNKYAIIEYLQELAQEANFKLIILTHNFDFFRTTSTRMKDVVMPQMASKSIVGITLENPKYVYTNPFSSIKEEILKGNKKAIITAIPFVRNIIEYTDSSKCKNYLTLTSLLHMKEDTNNIYLSDLYQIFNSTLNMKLDIPQDNEMVFKMIINQANYIIRDGIEAIDLDSKIILSIAIRLNAENFIINSVIKSDGHNKEICKIYESGGTQAGKLLKLYKSKFPQEEQYIKILDEVNLMTSENIHINSFMFEPIIDMSVLSLIELFIKIRSLFKLM